MIKQATGTNNKNYTRFYYSDFILKKLIVSQGNIQNIL